eukprot:jgi/Tetstr1/453821/TSEL_040772.t1
MAGSPSAPHALLYANHHPPLYRSRSCHRLHYGFPMVIDTDVRRDHDVQLEMTKFASRPPPTAKIAAADLMTDRRNLAQLARFLQRVKEAVHGLIWSAQVESWLVQQFITDGKASIEASAIKLREELNTFTILDRHLKAVDAEFSAKRKADNPHGNSPSPKMHL